MPLEKVEKNIIKTALYRYGNSYESKKLIANELGISVATLYNKINKYNMEGLETNEL
jgi:transcriptional regulator with PAS, ATPase and Fis domain